MALRDVLWRNDPEPYGKPPPLHLRVIDMCEMVKVLSWEFEGGQATPRISKKNTIVAVTDGTTVTKITLFEEYKHKMELGKTYYLKNYGVRGASPPYHILIFKETKFYKSSPVAVSDELIEEGKKLLKPKSVLTPTSEASNGRGFITLQGSVVEFSEIKKLTVGRDNVPMRTVNIQQGTDTTTVNLWREAAVFPLECGIRILITHIKKSNMYLQTTTFTNIEMVEEEKITVTAKVEGVSVGQDDDQLNIDLSDGSELVIEKTLWEPYEQLFEEGDLFVTVEKVGTKVTSLKAAQFTI